MTLYIHFGIYKAGSSYLQYICASQKPYLLDHGIYFPTSKEDAKMQAGQISKGNAAGLEAAMVSENKHNLLKLLSQWKQEAQQTNTKAVLISAEALVHQLAVQKRLDMLIEVAQQAGFTHFKAMGFFRDIADHAISTYKHRAKTGKHPDFKKWIVQYYETPILLENLGNTIAATSTQLQWTLRKFQKDSTFLKQAFFEDWLAIPTPIFEAIPKVNESVSLSEVMLLNQLKKAYPSVIDFFMEDLKALHKKDKANDHHLEAHIIQCFVDKLLLHQEKIDMLNKYFLEGEKLIIGEKKASSGLNISYAFSEKQLETVAHRIQYFRSWNGKIVFWRRRLSQLRK